MKIEQFKMKVTPKQSALVQEVLFRNGYAWFNTKTTIIDTQEPFLVFDSLGGERQPTLTYLHQAQAAFYEKKVNVEEITFEFFMGTYNVSNDYGDAVVKKGNNRQDTLMVGNYVGAFPQINCYDGAFLSNHVRKSDFARNCIEDWS